MSHAIYFDTSKAKETSPTRKVSSEETSDHQDLSNIFTWVYCLLVDSIQTQCDGIKIKAKQLAVNGYDQQRMIDRLNQIKWTNVPTVQKNHHTQRVTHRHKFVNPNGEVTFFDTYTFKRWTTIGNQSAIDKANITNSQRNKMRQDVEGGLSVLQQNAEMDEAKVNTDVNQSLTTTQETSSLLDMLKSLTNKILIRQHG